MEHGSIPSRHWTTGPRGRYQRRCPVSRSCRRKGNTTIRWWQRRSRLAGRRCHRGSGGSHGWCNCLVIFLYMIWICSGECFIPIPSDPVREQVTIITFLVSCRRYGQFGQFRSSSRGVRNARRSGQDKREHEELDNGFGHCIGMNWPSGEECCGYDEGKWPFYTPCVGMISLFISYTPYIHR